MTRTLAGSLLVVVLLTGCATAPITRQTPTPRAGSVSAASSVTPSATPSATPSRTPTPSALPSAKKLATAKLPTQVGDRRADKVTESAGGQTAAYYKPMATADVVVAAISPIGTAKDAAALLATPTQKGVATCGTLTVAGKPLAACVVPLDTGYVLVNASGTQTIDEVATFTAALDAMIP